jgi:hypothetical protein
MLIRQISVFVENKKGRLYNLTKTLADHGIDLKALSIADTSEFGILRCIVSDPEKTIQVIREANFTASITQVLGIEVANKPGGLVRILEVLKDNDIMVEYLYSFVGARNENALVIFQVDDVTKAYDVLRQAGLKLLTEDMV